MFNANTINRVWDAIELFNPTITRPKLYEGTVYFTDDDWQAIRDIIEPLGVETKTHIDAETLNAFWDMVEARTE